MEGIKKDVQNLTNTFATQDTISFDCLKRDGLGNVKPHDYQLYGIEWIVNSWLQRPSSGLILGDEMGLGKTLQSVSFTLHLKYHYNIDDPILILSPLSVIDGWNQEFKRSAASLKVLTYIGDKDKREEMRQDVASKYMTSNWKKKMAPFDVLLTTYEICLKDPSFLQRFSWKVLIVDEAHRLKNSSSMLYQELQMFDIGFKLLLTGTPVQNNLKELYSLLSFVSSDIFKFEIVDEFLEYFGNVSQENLTRKELHKLMKPFLLRRTKNEVILDLPKKSEIVMYCGMSDEQKKLYKAILLKDVGVFNQDGGNKTRLNNILMQLRKCCNHPYIFPGIEPEPFQLGEHLILTSGKLKILDKMLKLLKKSGHKVLVFSQMTTMLDIVQDYLGYRDYTYERLDGSVRGEERYLAVNNFNATDDTFIFLLSTRAGGQGLNLATADTVIFLDSDFNPQNDLQAAARAHRIGQTRPVKIIRLVSQNTVEEIVLKRAESKLKLTSTVVEGGQFSNVKSADDPNELNDILKFGLDDLFKDDIKDIDNEEIESLLGRTENGAWVSEKTLDSRKQDDELDVEKETTSMYMFEGFDYSKTKASDNDRSTFDAFVQKINDALQTDRNLRKDPKATLPICLPDIVTRKRKVLTDDEKAALKKKRDENRAKRMKLMKEKRIEKLEKLRETLNYITSKIELPEYSDSESVSSTDSDKSEEVNNDGGRLDYVVGDLTRPVMFGNSDRIIAHCVDDSGRWGTGGLFSAIDRISLEPKKQYELASKAKDLDLADVHLIKIIQETKTSSAVYVALIIAHTRDRNNVLSSLLLKHLSDALEKLYHIAKETGASVHFPRIGYNTPNFNWYGIEKLIKKVLAQRKIKTFIYYFKRRQGNAGNTLSTPQNVSAPSVTIASKSTTSENTLNNLSTPENVVSSSSMMFSEDIVDDLLAQSPDVEEKGETSKHELADIFTGCAVYFDEAGLEATEIKTLSRYIVAYDGDVDDMITSQTTHVVTSASTSPTSDFGSGNDVLKIVTSRWVNACIQSKRLVNEENYYPIMNKS